MAWGFIQGQKFSFASGTSQTGTLSTNVTAGRRLIVFAYVYGSGITLSSVSDSLGNQGAVAGKYDQIFSQSDTFNGHLYALTAPITTGGSCAITVTASGSASFISFAALEYSGLSNITGSGAWDLFVSSGGTIANSMGTGTSSGTVGSVGELAIAAFGDTLANGTTGIASPGGWVERLNDTASATDIPLLVDDQTPTAGNTLAWTTTFGGSDAGNGYAAGLVVFKLTPPTPTTWQFPPLQLPGRPGTSFTSAPRSTTVPKATTTDVGTRFICAPTLTGASLPLLSTTGVRGATGGNQRGQHLVYAQNTGRWWFFTYGPVLDSGTATSGSVAALNDTTKTWTSSTYNGASCLIIRGTGAGQAFEIGPNTSTSLPVKNNGDVVPPQPGIAIAPDSTSAYIILETRSVKAYVSSGTDLASATWSEATGSPSPTLPNNSGIDVSGGANDGGSVGSDIPTDGRLLAVGYMNVNGVDVVQLLTNENLHWIKYSERARLGVGSPSTISWDLTGTTTWYDSFDSHNEDAPGFPQTTAIRASNTNRWHILQHQNSLPHSGMVVNPSVTDDGSFNLAPVWGGVYSDLDIANFFAWCGSLTALDSGFMLAAYTKGTRDASPVGTGISHQTGIRYIESLSESAWPTTPGGADVSGLSTTPNSPNDWDIVAATTTDIHLVRRNSATVIEHVRYSGHGGSWGTVDTLPSQGLTGHLSGSGIALVTNGQSVWCFVIDSDISHSIKYLRWRAGSWDTAWTLFPTGGEYKNFITATWSSSTSQAAIAWTANAQQPFAVNYQVFIPPAVPGANPQQSFSKTGPYPYFIQDLRSANAPNPNYVDAKTRLVVSTAGVADVSTRFLVTTRPGAFLPPTTFHPGSSPGGYYHFLQDTRTADAPASLLVDLATRFAVQSTSGASYLLGNVLARPGLQRPEYSLAFIADIRAANAPISTAVDLVTRLVVVAPPVNAVPGSQTVSLVHPGLQGPVDWASFTQDIRARNAPSNLTVDATTRFTLVAPPGSLLPQNTYHPGRSPGGYYQFLQDTKSTVKAAAIVVDISTRFSLVARPGAFLPPNTYHPGISPGGYYHFLADVRTQDAPTVQVLDIATRLTINQIIGEGAFIQGIPHPGSMPQVGPFFRPAIRSSNASVTNLLDVRSRLVVVSSASTGVMSSYLFVGRLGRSDSQLGNMQLGIDRTFYVGALESMTGLETNTHQVTEETLILQPRSFAFSLQSRPISGLPAVYGQVIYGKAIYGAAARSGAITLQPRPFTLVVQSLNQGE